MHDCYDKHDPVVWKSCRNILGFHGAGMIEFLQKSCSERAGLRKRSEPASPDKVRLLIEVIAGWFDGLVEIETATGGLFGLPPDGIQGLD